MSNNLAILLVILASLQSSHSFSVLPSRLAHSPASIRSKLTTFATLNLKSRSQLSATVDDKVLAQISPWKSVVSANADLNEAVNEIIASISENNEESINKYNLAIFFTSSIYEASAFKYDDLFETLSKKMPGMKTMIGCTTGGVIGSLSPGQEPSEVEARASIGITFAALDDDVEASVFHTTPEDIKTYIKQKDSDQMILKNKGAVTFLFATDKSKATLSQYVATLGDKENAEAFGAVASSVTSLHVPKVFISKIENGVRTLERYSTGVAGLELSGNICVQTVVARSCLPVGALYRLGLGLGSE
jgi:small ligand-binding sensory domain FIST